MSKGKSSPKPAPVPETPKPQNEYYYQDGVLNSSRVYDAAKGGYLTNSYSSPEEKAITDKSTAFINNLVGTLPDKFNMSQDQIDEYRNAYADPQKRALEQSYNKALGAANTNANAGGMRNSVGFQGYLANQLEKNKAQGLADIESNAKLMEYDLPNKVLAPYTNAFNLVNAALQGQQANTVSSLEPAFQGSQAGNNFALSNYGNQIAQMQAYNQQLQNNQQNSFTNRLISKYLPF